MFKQTILTRIRNFTLAALVGLGSQAAIAQLANLADVPLADAPSTAVLPNLMYILDDSGSMDWTYMPDNVQNMASGASLYNCKSCTSSTCTYAKDQCMPASDYGEAPYYTFLFNQIYYNPNIYYSPGVTSAGVSLGNSPKNAATNDFYLDATTTNLETTFSEVYYCTTNSPSAADLANPLKCVRNGVHNVAPFVAGGKTYFVYGISTAANEAYPIKTTFFNKVTKTTSNPHYFTLTANEYCSDAKLTTCQLANPDGSAPAGFSIPAPIRYCKATADASSALAVSGTSGSPATAKCQKKFDITNYPYPRYGRFARTDLLPATAAYTKGPDARRPDCAAAASCTYAEEIQNFANWHSYYRKRLMMMKTATGRAFLPIDDRYRVGFMTINAPSPVNASTFLKVSPFDSTQRSTWYNVLYNSSTNGSTPLREALSRVGRYYAGITSGVNSGMINASNPDPVQFSCQQNFALLTTDGYWNGSTTYNLTGSTVGNQDNTNGGFTTRSIGAYDGGLAGASDTLADVAAYYYKTDLRTTGPVSLDNVPTVNPTFDAVGNVISPGDPAAHQHMTTFTLGLGLQGLMDYSSDYLSNPVSDFANIKAGASGACAWTAGTCNWPVPAANSPTALDDLWHAAANGHGIYFSASDPNSLADGLSGALSALKVLTASASASATSSPNITPTNNQIFSSTFRTNKWDGEVAARRIDPTTGNVLPTITWSAQALLDGKVSGSSDSRTIYLLDSSAANKLKPFQWSNLTNSATGGLAAERPYFANKCPGLSQCPTLTSGDQTTANDGSRLVGFLRGQTQDEVNNGNGAFRQRDHVLGDSVNATPAFVKDPQFNYADAVTPDYASFKSANATRQGVLYIAANDGMLHAFNGDNGQEMWAYVPRIVMPNLYKLATDNWDVKHAYSVDGSPQIADVFIGGAWKTYLVAGLDKGGRGFYALDVTDPFNPKGLWEFCSDSTLCANSDVNMGYSFGPPVITKRASDGKWVVMVTSGLNNVSPGDGKGYLYVLDAQTGTLLAKTPTLTGSTTTPSGFSHIAGYAPDPASDNTSKYVYGGDLLGNVWRFDMQADPPVLMQLAQLNDGGSPKKPQSITTRPEISVINGLPIIYIGTGRYLGTDDLVDPATIGLPFAYQQSIYAIRDTNTSYGDIRASGLLVKQTLIDSGITRTTSQNKVDYTSKDGWYLDFNPSNKSPGERVNLDPQIASGTLVVVTNVPSNGACTVGGDSWVYFFDFKDGTNVDTSATVAQKITGQITVGNILIELPSKDLKTIITGATGSMTTQAVPKSNVGGIARRVSWREIFQ
jgi:type IV pilus assembly protein PilY1